MFQLKAGGFGPVHIASLYLAQQLTLGFAAAIVGVIVAAVATPLILSGFAEVLYSGTSADLSPGTVVAVVAGIGLLIVVFTLVPAWRAGRTSTVQAISGRHTRVSSKPSRLAGLAMRLHLPHIVAFSAKDIFARKTRAWLTVASVVVVAAVAMMTLTLFDMFDRFTNDPVSLGPGRLSCGLNGWPSSEPRMPPPGNSPPVRKIRFLKRSC